MIGRKMTRRAPRFDLRLESNNARPDVFVIAISNCDWTTVILSTSPVARLRRSLRSGGQGGDGDDGGESCAESPERHGGSPMRGPGPARMRTTRRHECRPAGPRSQAAASVASPAVALPDLLPCGKLKVRRVVV